MRQLPSINTEIPASNLFSGTLETADYCKVERMVKK